MEGLRRCNRPVLYRMHVALSRIRSMPIAPTERLALPLHLGDHRPLLAIRGPPQRPKHTSATGKVPRLPSPGTDLSPNRIHPPMERNFHFPASDSGCQRPVALGQCRQTEELRGYWFSRKSQAVPSWGRLGGAPVPSSYSRPAPRSKSRLFPILLSSQIQSITLDTPVRAGHNRSL